MHAYTDSQIDLFGVPAVTLPPIVLRPRMSERERVEARRLAEQGAELAAEKADREQERWKVAALSFFLAYGRMHGGEFQTEEVRHASTGHVHAPKNPRAWGHVAMAAKKLKQIEWARFGTSADPKSHCAPSNVWRWIGEHVGAA